MSVNKWERRFMQMACLVASWSKDQYTQVGCVLTDEVNQVIATGFNGTSRGLDEMPNEDDRLSMTIHAEINALIQARRVPVFAYVWPYAPCSHCMAALAQAGVQRVVTNRMPGDKWRPDLVQYICEKKQIELVLLDGP